MDLRALKAHQKVGGGLPVHFNIWIIVLEAVMRSMPPRVEMWRGILMARYIQRWRKYIGLKTYKEIKPRSFEESEDKVVEGERDNSENDEYVYYFLMERAPVRSL